MEYKRIVHTVVETPTHLAIANKLFGEEERADIVALVAADPECGDLIRGTGGFARSEWHGKEWERVAGRELCISGAMKDFRFFSSWFFRRMRKKNLSMAERNALKKRADSIFETYGR
jgi:hypothetical protein